MITDLPESFQKFEWHCRGERRVLTDYVLQARPSGLRAKRRATAPSLVAMTTSQVPIIGWQRRYMSVRECARLQGMGSLEHLPGGSSFAYQALGNAVNVDVVRRLVQRLTTHAAALPLVSGHGDSRHVDAQHEDVRMKHATVPARQASRVS